MIYLLFIQRISDNSLSYIQSPYEYWYAVCIRFEPIPFRTTIGFIEHIRKFDPSDISFRNLAGNVILFIPLGLFLPAVFNKQHRFRVFIITTMLLIFTVEIIQMFTLLGTFDIDDIMLNSGGAAIGFAIYRLFSRDNKKSH